MRENEEEMNKEFERLYGKYKQLSIKLDNQRNPLLISVFGGTLAAVTLAIGNQVFNLNLPVGAIAAGFFVGEAVATLPLAKKIYKISRTEKKLIVIADKYSNVVDYPEGYYDLDKKAYLSSNEAYIDFYHNQINKEDNGPVKRLK